MHTLGTLFKNTLWKKNTFEVWKIITSHGLRTVCSGPETRTQWKSEWKCGWPTDGWTDQPIESFKQSCRIPIPNPNNKIGWWSFQTILELYTHTYFLSWELWQSPPLGRWLNLLEDWCRWNQVGLQQRWRTGEKLRQRWTRCKIQQLTLNIALRSRSDFSRL